MNRHKAMLDYLASAGFMKTYEQLKEEAPDMVRIQLRVQRALTSYALFRPNTLLIPRERRAVCWRRSGRA
jgi:hypothetical protein